MSHIMFVSKGKLRKKYPSFFFQKLLKHVVQFPVQTLRFKAIKMLQN